MIKRSEHLSTFQDEELWELLRTGDSTAVSDLFRRHYRILYSYGLKISRDESITQDCIQEVFVELWNKKESLPAVTHVKAYLLKFLRRRIFHTLQQGDKKASQDWQYVQEFDMIISHEDLLINEQLSADIKLKLNAALQKLTPRQREVIYLRFFDGLSCEAISEVTSLQYQSVVNLIHEAIKKLREKVAFTTLLLLLVPVC